MIHVAWVRGAYLNNFEGQNYDFGDTNIALTGIASRHPVHSEVPFQIIKLPSMADIQTQVPLLNKPIKFLSNRVLGDSQVLYGLEQYAHKFDIFHTADPHYYYSYQLARLRSQNKIKRLLMTSWETIPHNNESTTMKKKIKYYSMKHADVFLCYTKRAKNVLIKEGIDTSKIEIVQLGVNIDRFSPLERSVDDVTILFVGRLVPEKGVFDIYDAFKRLNQHNFKLVIIGQGELEQELKDRINQDGLSRNVTISHAEYNQMPLLYKKADVFVLPSKHTKTWEEQYGMVLLEAMASGLPIISTQSGAIPDIVGDAGLLVEEGNINKIVAGLRFFADAGNRLIYGSKARARAEEYFDSRQTSASIGRIYEKIM